MSAKTRKKAAEDAPPDLPKHPVRGDIVAIKDDRRGKLEELCKAAGYADFDPRAHHEVLACEPWQSTQRLRIAAQPFCLGRVDVVLVEVEEDRRKRLRGLGWRV